MDTTYNGWSNYETWVWNLWIENDEGENDFWISRAADVIAEEESANNARRVIAREMENSAIDQRTDLNVPHGPFVDLMAAAIGSIDWNEIAEYYVEKARDSIAA